MAMRYDSPMYYEMNPGGPNVEIEDAGRDSVVRMREVRWTPEGNFKLDIRRYFTKQDGEEIPGKGVSIAHPERLVYAMIDSQYGSPGLILQRMNDQGTLVDGLGVMTARMDDDSYEQFKGAVDSKRDEEIKKRGISPKDFMEVLDE